MRSAKGFMRDLMSSFMNDFMNKKLAIDSQQGHDPIKYDYKGL